MPGYSPPMVYGTQTLTVVRAHDTEHMIQGGGILGSLAYPLANLAFYVPFSVSETVTAVEGWVFAGATSGGNFDIGIYSDTGSRLTSSGATAKGNSTLDNTTAMTNLTLTPDVRYYMAIAADATGNYNATAYAAGLYQAHGILESTSSYVLPSSPTLSITTRAFLPDFGLNLYTVAF